MTRKLTHIDNAGKARMVNVGRKKTTLRKAVAGARVIMKKRTVRLIKENAIEKGDVLGTARIAGITAAKKAHELIPLTHPIGLDHADVEFEILDNGILVTATASVKARTGVEMEALTAAAAAGLTIYDMAKSADRGMVITDLALLSKSGGKSGSWRRRG